MPNPENKPTIPCYKCGTGLLCGAVNGDAICWCDSLPNIMPLNEDATSCYCKSCLEKELQKKDAKN
ncbi:cysteine-rich CWC family protein [Adhaeribacter terreus]|uniref:Cysteine-rich CWC family protein n=1 Tax=Adhaeribacter terreus TaxID=529703 RepID=A0ABW0E857_9BACT